MLSSQITKAKCGHSCTDFMWVCVTGVGWGRSSAIEVKKRRSDTKLQNEQPQVLNKNSNVAPKLRMEDEALLDCLLLSDMFHLLICVVFLGLLMYFREEVHCVPVFPFCHVSLIAHICHRHRRRCLWRKTCHVEKFQISLHDSCREM